MSEEAENCCPVTIWPNVDRGVCPSFPKEILAGLIPSMHSIFVFFSPPFPLKVIIITIAGSAKQLLYLFKDFLFFRCVTKYQQNFIFYKTVSFQVFRTSKLLK